MTLRIRIASVSALTLAVLGWASAIALFVLVARWSVEAPHSASISKWNEVVAWSLAVCWNTGILVGGAKGVLGIVGRRHLTENVLAVLLAAAAVYVAVNVVHPIQ